MSALWTPPYQAVLDTNTEAPQLISGAALYFYEAGTTTPLTVYSDNALQTPHSWPVEADSSGRFPPIFLPVGNYKVILKDDVGGSTLWTADNVPGTAEDAAELTSAIPDTPILTKVSDYTITAADIGSVVNGNPTGASFLITLPSAVTVGDGSQITIRHVGSANEVRIVTASTQTITSPSTGNTKTSLSLTGYGESITFVSDGANWHVTGRVNPLIDVTTGVITIVDRIAAAPSGPTNGARYIVSSGYSSFSTGDIIEYTGQTSTYNKYTPPTNCGWLAYVQDEAVYYSWQSSAWTELAASQAAMETGTATNVYVTPGRQKFHPMHAKAWAYVTNTGTPALTTSSGISSVSDGGTGQNGINFTTQMSSANYGVVSGFIGSASGLRCASIFSVSLGTGGFTLNTLTATSTSSTALTDIDLSGAFAVFGDV